MPILVLASGLIGLLITILFIVFFVVACISVERTKNETIEIRKLLENINKIQIAVYKKEFNITSDKIEPREKIPSEQTKLDSVPESNLKFDS